MTTREPYNPLDLDCIAESIVRALESKSPVPLDDVPQFNGAGLYAVYYLGAFPAYQALARANTEHLRYPIYVGKAVPAGSRKGLTAYGQNVDKDLWRRINQHRISIDATINLHTTDFVVRWLVTEPIWIPLGESAIIRLYGPLWNVHLAGFGNNDPGRGRHGGKLSVWDLTHPGRAWAEKLQASAETEADVLSRVEQYLTAKLGPLPPDDVDVKHQP